MLELASFARGNNEVSASKGCLAAASNTTDKTVQRALKEFKQRGWVKQQYQSRGLADPTGQRTNKYSLDWPRIRLDAEHAFARNTEALAKVRKEREDAFKVTTLGDPSARGPTEPLKGDKKGDNESAPAPPKGDNMTPNLVSLLGRDSKRETENSRDSESPEATPPVSPCDWGTEFMGTEGVTFATQAGSVTIPGDFAERCVSWTGTDGFAALKSSLAFMAQQGMIAPNRIALVPFLGEYVRWAANGHSPSRLTELAKGFKADWGGK